MTRTPSGIEAAVQQVIDAMMARVLVNVLERDPFDSEQHRKAKPLYAALVPDEVFKGAHFERRFVTPFGHVWEKLAVAVAVAAGGKAEMGTSIHGTVREGQLRRIAATLDGLEHGGAGGRRQRPNWAAELSSILAADGRAVDVTVVTDVLVTTKDGKRLAFELKAPLPNSDQTKVSKEKLLKLWSMNPRRVDGAYFALPYNPFGSREQYAWSFPERWFSMRTDSVVLIGEDFWDIIGGRGAYGALINAVDRMGKQYRDRIYREYLEIEPPVTPLATVRKVAEAPPRYSKGDDE